MDQKVYKRKIGCNIAKINGTAIVVRGSEEERSEIMRSEIISIN